METNWLLWKKFGKFFGFMKYIGPLPISNPKFVDLRKLCNSAAIPQDYHFFYNNLQTSDTISDCLDEPDVEEDDYDEEF